MARAFLVLALVSLVAACAGGQAIAEAPTRNPVPEVTLRPIKVKERPSLDRALSSLDAGDLAGAEEMLAELQRDRGSARALLEAVRRVQGRAGLSPSLLANVPARVVPRPPFDPPSRVRSAIVHPRIAKRTKVDAAPASDVLATLGDPLHAARGARGLAESLSGKGDAPPALPATYGGVRLVMALPQRDDRWLLLYGKDSGKARFVVVVDPRPGIDRSEQIVAFDFGSFIEPPETIEPRSTHETMTWAELDGGRLYVANAHRGNLDASRGRNAYVTAIDMKTTTIVWRSAGQVADGGSFVLTDGHVICSYEDFEYMRLFVLDRETGKTVAALPIPIPARALWVSGSAIKARALTEELTFAGIPGVRAEVLDEAIETSSARLPRLAPAGRLATFALDAAAAQKRASAIASLDGDHPFDATKTLRALVEVDGAAGNFAVETLLSAAEQSLETARASSEETVLRRAKVVSVGSPAQNRRAPIKRGSALRLKKISEAKDLPFRGASIFDERRIPSAEIDKPYPGHAGDLPDYVPTRLLTKLLFSARYASKTMVAFYGGATVLFDRDTRMPETRLDFTALGASADWPQIHRLEVDGDVVIAAGGGATAWLTAFDRNTGDAYWSTPLAVSDMLLIDGWIVASTSSPPAGGGYATDIVVVDASTGAIASRIRSVRADAIARQGDEIVGGGPTSRVVLAITRD